MPWSGLWDRNYFIETWPVLRDLFGNGFVRGAVTGVGIVNVIAGLAELHGLMPWSRRLSNHP